MASQAAENSDDKLRQQAEERVDLGVEPVSGPLQCAAHPHLLEFLLPPDEQKEVLEDLDCAGLDLLAAQRVVVQDLLDQIPGLVLGEQLLGDADQRFLDEVNHSRQHRRGEACHVVDKPPRCRRQDAEVVVERIQAFEVHLVPRLADRAFEALKRQVERGQLGLDELEGTLENPELAELVEHEGAERHQPHEPFDQRHRGRLDALPAQRVVLDDVCEQRVARYVTGVVGQLVADEVWQELDLVGRPGGPGHSGEPRLAGQRASPRAP